jgi:LPXTG-motif cell wall-anchored protein
MVTPCTRRQLLTTTGAEILGMAVAALGCLGLGLGAMVIVRRRRNGEVW